MKASQPRPEPRKFRDVTIQDITPFANKNCPACIGQGFILKLGQERAQGTGALSTDTLRPGGKANQTQKGHVACACAVRRWLKAHNGRFALDSKKNLKVLLEEGASKEVDSGIDDSGDSDGSVAEDAPASGPDASSGGPALASESSQGTQDAS